MEGGCCVVGMEGSVVRGLGDVRGRWVGMRVVRGFPREAFGNSVMHFHEAVNR